MASGVRHKVGLDTKTGVIIHEPPVYGDPLRILDPKFIYVPAGTDPHIPKPVRVNLRNRVIRATASPIPPFIQATLKFSISARSLGKLARVTTSRPYFGSSFEGIHAASLKYNFTIAMAFGRKAQGIKNANGSWNGVSGEVVNRQADLAVLLAQDLDRYDDLDASGSFFGIFNVGFTTVQPLVNIHPEALVYPYDKQVWALIVLSLLVITPLFHTYFKHDAELRLRLRQRQQHRCLKLRGRGDSFPGGRWASRHARIRQDDFWWNAVSISFKIATEQDIPKRLSSRLRPLTGLWMLSLIIITTGYKSNLLTFLTLPYEERLPDSFPELATKYLDYTIYYHDVGGTDFRYFDRRQDRKSVV